MGTATKAVIVVSTTKMPVSGPAPVSSQGSLGSSGMVTGPPSALGPASLQPPAGQWSWRTTGTSSALGPQANSASDSNERRPHQCASIPMDAASMCPP